MDIWLQIAAILVLFGLSAFFSSVESAYFSLSRATLERMGASTQAGERRVARLMSDPRLLLTAVLTGNTIVNTAAATIAALATVDLAESFGWNVNLAVGIEVILITILMLYFAELIPKLQALTHAEKWAAQTSLLVQAAKYILYPISRPLAGFTTGLGRMFGVEPGQSLGMSEEEVRALVQVGHEHGALELDEQKMIHSIFQLGDTIAREVMVPRIDVVGVRRGANLDELIEIIKRHGHSRLPVYEGTIDNIIGVIHVKDLLAASQSPADFELSEHMRKPFFVPEEKKIDDLLRDFQSAKVHMAIVTDEYGGTSGLVTLEDVIEEIVGEIQDEYDRESPLATRVDDKTIIANGKLPIYDLNEMLGYQLIEESDAFDTLGGLVLNRLGVVPRRGDHFDEKDYGFTVEEVIGRKITRVKIVKEESPFENV